MTGTTFYLPFEPVLMEWLQSFMGPAGVAVASAVTMLGEELVLIAVLGFIYWCWDKELGKNMGVSIVVGITWNPLFKNIVLRRRPYFDNPGIKCLKPVDSSADIYDISAQGYSFPSGHSTNAAILYGSLPVYKRNRWLTVIGIVLPLLVGVSRVLLGVHYPTDVLVGWVMGAAIVLLLAWLQRTVKRRWLLHLILFLTALPGVFYCKTTDYYTAIGLMAGLFLAIPFEERFVRFENTREPLWCVLRVAGGFACYFALNTALKLPFPKELLESATTAAFLIRAVRYAIVAFVCFGVYPILFKLRKKWNSAK